MNAFESELLSHRADIIKYAMKLYRGRKADAEDLTQDVIIKALAARNQFQRNTNMGAWLSTITFNTFLNQIRHAKIRRLAVEQEILPNGVGESTKKASQDVEATCTSTLRSEIRSKIRQLPIEFAEVIALVDIGGYRYLDAAAKIGCPLGTVMSRLYRGRRLLAGVLAA
ncbi:MAG TPA: RNA polymerase sigma factor [Methylobacter sp.]|jgi:RNA polymerase sigma-70 factor (ECF subfamily)